jgi:hypothetical protein
MRIKELNAEDFLGSRNGPYAQHAMVASDEAVRDAGFDFRNLDKTELSNLGIRYRWIRNFSNRNVELAAVLNS